MIPYGKQSINQEDIDAVVRVLKSDNLTQGTSVPEFERKLSQRVNADYGVACNSATSALHLACLALGVGKGDEVWTSPISFVASANCVLYCNSKIDFIDIDLSTSNLNGDAFKEKIEKRINSNQPLPKAIIVVHMSGLSSDMEKIADIARQYEIKIIEDASHAVGASYKGGPVGNCRYSDITVFSFHPVKIITTGEGGMAVTNNQKYYKKMENLRSHGVTKKPSEMISFDGDWYYEQYELGFNYRLTDLQASLGLSQLNRLDEFIGQRRNIAAFYLKNLSGLPISLPSHITLDESSWHLFIIKLKKGLNRKRVFDELRKMSIGVHVHYIPIYKQPYYQKLGFSNTYCPNAELYYQSALSIPLYHGMTEPEMSQVVSSLKEVLA